jgi:hypothetical protein
MAIKAIANFAVGHDCEIELEKREERGMLKDCGSGISMGDEERHWTIRGGSCARLDGF